VAHTSGWEIFTAATHRRDGLGSPSRARTRRKGDDLHAPKRQNILAQGKRHGEAVECRPGATVTRNQSSPERAEQHSVLLFPRRPVFPVHCGRWAPGVLCFALSGLGFRGRDAHPGRRSTAVPCRAALGYGCRCPFGAAHRCDGLPRPSPLTSASYFPVRRTSQSVAAVCSGRKDYPCPSPQAKAWGYMLSPLRGEEDSHMSFSPSIPTRAAATD
jgi:hypothetical protein